MTALETERGLPHQWRNWRTSRIDHAILQRAQLERSDWKDSELIRKEYKETVHMVQVAIFSMYLDVLEHGNFEEIASTQNKLRMLRYALPPQI
mgnify:CR=1 FL=1